MGLKIEILCSSPDHPVNLWLARWMTEREDRDTVSLVHSKAKLGTGDILFLISCSELIGSEIRSKFQNTAVVHASDLPEGRGWSPHVWTILGGADAIVVSAIEAEDRVDSGAIWVKKRIEVPKTALCNEINARLFDATLDLMTIVYDMVVSGQPPQPQDDRTPTYWPRRTPKDSEIDPNQSIASQFDTIRVCDPDRYPAVFQLHGETFELRLTRQRQDP